MPQQIAEFLLEIPPLDEIGGKITHVIEQYRAGILQKKVCVDRILNEYPHFLQEYIKTSEILNNQIR